MGPGCACVTVVVECHRCGINKENLTHVGENQPGLLEGGVEAGWAVVCIVHLMLTK